jgi:hypothetical protein
MNQLKRRLTALESAERTAPRFPDITAGLMISYATPEERAAWEAAGRPEIDRAAIERMIDEAYDAAD